MQTIPSGEGHLLERRTLPPLSCTTAKMQPTKLPESLGTVYPEHDVRGGADEPTVLLVARLHGYQSQSPNRMTLTRDHEAMSPSPSAWCFPRTYCSLSRHNVAAFYLVDRQQQRDLVLTIGSVGATTVELPALCPVILGRAFAAQWR